MSIGSWKGRARIAIALGLGAGTLALAGCGGGGDDFANADLEAGKTAFAACGACHTMAAAGSTGSDAANPNAGPNLDDAFRASREAGMDEDQFAGVVKRWIAIAQPPMPRDIVTGEDAVNVAAYVASVAGRSDESDVRAAAPEPPEAPVPDRQEIN